MTPALHRLYFGRADSIDPLLEEFLAATQALADKSLKGPVAADDPDLLLVNAIGPARLLSALDKAVAYYEADGEAGVRALAQFRVCRLAGGAGSADCLGIFDFRADGAPAG